jgi:phage-related protein
MYQFWYIYFMPTPTLDVRFYKTEAGTEPVRDWLKDLSAIDRKAIGEDIKTVQLGWPLGMPLVRKMDGNLWEVRVRLQGRTARVLFTLDEHVMVLLHGFIKKSQATPKDDLKIAISRMKKLRSES